MVGMDLDDFRTILETAGVDVWTFIDAAMEVASMDYGNQLKQRRDGIMERLFALTSNPSRCPNCEADDLRQASPNGVEIKGRVAKKGSPVTPPSDDGDDGIDPFGGLFDDEQKKILEIKEQLEIPDQSEDGLVELLQSLADMDITFQALKDTDIGRYVNRLRKHSSNDVRRLVKHLVRKWKEIVDDWVRLYQPGEQNTSTLIADGDSPQQKITQNGHHQHQVPDFASSPNPHNGSSGSDKNNSEQEQPKPKPKPKPIPRREAPPPKTAQSMTPAAQNRYREQKESNFDSDRLASARKRLHDCYREAENAKKLRTIQVMDIHEIPKPKNGFISRNKGGGSQSRHW